VNKYNIKHLVTVKLTMLGQIESYMLGNDFCEYAEHLEQYFILNVIKQDKNNWGFINVFNIEKNNISG